KHKGSPHYHFDFQVRGRRFHASTGTGDRRSEPTGTLRGGSAPICATNGTSGRLSGRKEKQKRTTKYCGDTLDRSCHSQASPSTKADNRRSIRLYAAQRASSLRGHVTVNLECPRTGRSGRDGYTPSRQPSRSLEMSRL